jgi:uncharacterized RDD family membrane protein YckC
MASTPLEDGPKEEAPVEHGPVIEDDPGEGAHEEPSSPVSGDVPTDPVSADEPAHAASTDLTGDPVRADLLADPGQRLLARIVDTLVVGLPVVMVIRAVVHGHAAEVIAPPIVAGALFLYEWPQLALWGRTLGKRFAGVQVVRESLAPPDGGGDVPGVAAERSEGPEGCIGLFRALMRATVYAAPIAVRPVPILGIIGGLLWVVNAGALFEGDRRQAGHDRLAGTVVVKRPGRSGS